MQRWRTITSGVCVCSGTISKDIFPLLRLMCIRLEQQDGEDDDEVANYQHQEGEREEEKI